jgi:CBS domain
MPPVELHMSRDLLTVEAELPVVAVAKRMADRNVGAVIVLENGRLVGIMTERDLMRAVARGLDDDAVVGECMTPDPDDRAGRHDRARGRLDDPRRLSPSAGGRRRRRRRRPRDLVQVVVEDSAPRGA